MKKINREAAAASVNLGGLPTPEQASTAGTATAPARPTQTTALTLEAAGSPQLPTSLVEPASAIPWLGFFEKAGDDSRRAAVVAQLGSLTVGTPYVGKGNRYYKANEMAFCLLGAPVFHAWVVYGGDNREERVWLEKPGFDTYEGRRVTEIVRCVLLGLPGVAPMPEELGAAVVLTASFRSAKVPAIRTLIQGVSETMTDEWAKLNGRLVEAHPNFRVAGTLTISPDVVKSGQNKGRSYAKANMKIAPISMGQATAIQTWAKNGGLDEMAEAFRIHSSVVDKLSQLVRSEDE